MSKLKLVGCLIAVCCCLLGQAAVAGDGPWPGFSGINGKASNAMTSQTNPAGMSRLAKPELIAQAVLVNTESNDEISVNGLGLSGDDDDTGTYGGPLFYYVRPLNERWHVGLSLAVPAGFGDDYGDNSPTRYLVEEWSLAYVALVPSVAYKINDKWSVGLGAQINYADYEVENSVLNIGEPDGEMTLDADGVAVSFNAGVLYQLSDRTRLGFNYRQGVDMELDGDPKFKRLSQTTRDLLDAAGLLDIEVEIDSELPSVFLAGVYHEFGNGWGAALDVARIGWSDFKLTEFGFLEGTLFESDPDYDDVWAVSTGVAVPLNNRWTLGFSLAYSESPIDDDERTFLFRIDDTWMLGAGVEYALGNDRSVVFNVVYTDLGDGKIESPPLPFLGQLEAEYDEHWGIAFDFQYRWGSF